MNIQKLLYQNIFWRGLFFGSAFLLNVLIARHFDAAITGWIYYLFTFFSFFTLIGSLSLEAGMIYFGSKEEISLQKMAGLSILWTIFIALLVVLVYFFMVIFGEEVPAIKFQYALLFICGNIFLSFITSLFYAKQNYVTSNVTAIIVNIVLMVLLFSINEKSFLNNETFIYIYFGSFLVTAIVLAFQLNKYLPSSKFEWFSKKDVIKIFRYSSLAFLSNVVFFILYKIDYWFVNRYCSLEELGNYIQISKLAQLFFILPGILAASLFPLIAGNHINKAEDYLKTISRSIFFTYLLACGLLALVGKWLFPFVFGEGFSGMYMPFLFLIPGILALSTLYTLTAYFSGINKVSVNLKGSIVAIVFIIGGDALLIPKYGIVAAAAVSSFGYIVYHIYVLYTFNRIHKSGVIDFFYFKAGDFKKLKSSILKNSRIYEKK